MSKRIICDRCGSTVEPGMEEVGKVFMTIEYIGRYNPLKKFPFNTTYRQHYFDLCMSCAELRVTADSRFMRDGGWKPEEYDE